MNSDLFTTFLKSAKDIDFSLKISTQKHFKYTPLTNEALFHLPLISICLLVLAKSKSSSPNTSEAGRMVGVLLEMTIQGFKGSAQMLGWSATLRKRTAEAISFLESFDLIEVGDDGNRKIALTRKGKKFISSIEGEETGFGVVLRYMSLKQDTIRETQ